jgi:hypothetical protein
MVLLALPRRLAATVLLILNDLLIAIIDPLNNYAMPAAADRVMEEKKENATDNDTSGKASLERGQQAIAGERLGQMAQRRISLRPVVGKPPEITINRR